MPLSRLLLHPRPLPDPPRRVALLGCQAAALVASSSDPQTTMTIFFDAVGVVLLSCTRAVFGSAGSLRGPVQAWLVQSRSHFLPDYIRLPRDVHGNMLSPKLHVTALVERRHVWDRLIKMDGPAGPWCTASCAIRALAGTFCHLTCRSAEPQVVGYRRREVKFGATMAAYFFQGAFEYVFPGHPLLSIVEPMGAVPKKGPGESRHIFDAWRGNKWLADWGVRYYSACNLAFALSLRAIVNSHDIQVNNSYSIAVLACCTVQLI